MSVSAKKHGLWKAVMSYAGWGIGLASLMIAVYAEFIKKDAPDLEYEILSSTDFINNSETSANLKIFVDTIDVQENHLNITAYNIKIENKGTEHIRYDDYDKGAFGLKIIDGELLEPPVLLHSSTSHIKNSYIYKNDSLSNNSFLDIPTLSLDIDDNYTIRVVLIHNAEKTPRFIPEGKIVGQKTIEFQELQASEPGFWTIVLSGKWYIHIVRFFVYLIAVAITGIIFAVIISLVSDVIGKRKRKNRMKELAKKKKLVEFVKNDYIENGEYIIVHMHDIFSKNETDISTQYKKSKGFTHSKRALEKNNRNAVRFHRNRYNRIQMMIDKGYLEISAEDNDKLEFNKEAKQSVQAIYVMLDSKDLLSKATSFEYYPEEMLIERIQEPTLEK